MNKLIYICAFFILGISCDAASETIYYNGTMEVRGYEVPAKATFEEADYLPDPIIEITYKLDGKEYLSRYMSSFGDKVKYKPTSIIVYNDSSEKKQNYYFKGKKVSWLKSLLP